MHGAWLGVRFSRHWLWHVSCAAHVSRVLCKGVAVRFLILPSAAVGIDIAHRGHVAQRILHACYQRHSVLILSPPFIPHPVRESAGDAGRGRSGATTQEPVPRLRTDISSATRIVGARARSRIHRVVDHVRDLSEVAIEVRVDCLI